MVISVCDNCYKNNKGLVKGVYKRTDVKDGEVFNVYHCESCNGEYEEKLSD